MKPSILLWVLCLCIIAGSRAQVINNGSIVLDTGSVLLMNNINLVNNGSVTKTIGTIRFAGIDTSFITGSADLHCYNLEINKNGNNPVSLLRNINIGNQLVFTTGYLHLNKHVVILTGSAVLSGEKETSRVIGTDGGYIEVAGNLNAPDNINPGNLGALITSSQNLGLVTVRRGHVAQNITGISRYGVNRYFDIAASNNASLNATLRFRYLDAELNANNENLLSLWKSVDNMTWTSEKFTTREAGNNFVELTGIAGFSRWTIAETNVTTGIFDPPANGGNALRLWPNPYNRDINVLVFSSKTTPATLMIIDVAGRLVMTKRISLVTGENRFSFNLSYLQQGVYELKILGKEGSVITTKMVRMAN